uniref:EGF-like domain-containing protein n=1 Tax=Sus scrofa TaxID=9823 RepID=A0A8D1PHM8_PIG
MTNKLNTLVTLVVLHSMLINGKTTCKRHLVEEWRTQPSSYVVNWTLTENICLGVYGDCWFGDVNAKINTSENHVVPQICPLQIQLGDILVISSEPSLEYPEINLMNVSEASFIDCLQNTTTEDQLLFGCKLKGMHIINSHWLSVGTHYFITVMANGKSLCQLGLRLNVTVKEQFCQEYQSSELCSGHGKCLTEVWSKTYSCHCQGPYSGKYCQELDPCSYKPCKHNGSCINKGETWNKQGYECICYPPFTGINCSEIIGKCQPHIHFHGNCSNVASNSFICECEEPFSGSLCEESLECCCLEGFFSQNYETDVNVCSPNPCQNGTDCIDIPKDIMCMCLPIFTDKLCKHLQIPHDAFPCKTKATDMKYEENYHCSFMPGFTGKNCEKVIDHCRLLTINCLNEGWCFNIIGRFRYICTPGHTRNSCWFVKNACFFHLYPCYCGAISHNICQAEDASPPQFKYVWRLGLTGSEGQKCEVFTGDYFFLIANCTKDTVCVNQPEALGHVCWFLHEGKREMSVNGCRCLTEENNKRYQCLCIPTWLCKMYLENTTDYEENRCQQEDNYEDEINIPRYLCII